MAKPMNRRVFVGQMAKVVAAGALVRGLETAQAETPATGPAPAGTQPALEWRNKQPTMGYTRLGRTNFMTSRCVFGAGGIAGRGGDLRLLEMAVERGLNYIDTGRAYPKSEATIAGLVKKHRDRVWIVSKAGHIGWPDMTIKQTEDAKAARLFTDQLDESLRELTVDTIDCYMIQGAEHDWIITMDALYDAFVKARKAGKVRYFGLATHANLPKVCELAAESGRYDVVMLAVNPNSLADLAPSIEKMRKAGIGVVSMKTAAPIRQNPKAFDEKYAGMFGGMKLSAHQRALAYMLFRGGIDAFNSHITSREILDENLAVPTLKLGSAELDRLERAAVAEARGACRHCGACARACPEGIRVSDALRCHAYAHGYGDREAARALYEVSLRAQASRCRRCGSCQAVCPEGMDLRAVVASVNAEMA